MTNQEFADLIGCHVTTVSTYRNGRRLPSVRLLESIRQALDMSQDDIIAVWSQGPQAFATFLRENVFDGVAA